MDSSTQQVKYHNPEDPEEQILVLLAERPLNTEAIAIVLGLDKFKALRLLNRLKRYNQVEVKTKKATFWWGLAKNGEGEE